ncbi:histidine kinase [Niabella sp. CC-SYL272]|uniref:sensor histidine kinase n=1 Tax=Niabella agricola TaxID=2891571 RepID=UPI001F204793|nr:histidine kinase [Niabella agricola]MCF3110504.1 histidine kinase [Niabella agricola]
MRLIILILLCCTSQIRLPAQTLSFRHLNSTNGLLSDQGIQFCEDRLGRLCIATDEGVNVFDGLHVDSYTSYNKSGIGNSRIKAIYCDRRGTLWIATPVGIQYKSENTAVFLTLPNPGKLPLEKVVFIRESMSGLLLLTRDSAFLVPHGAQVRPLNKLSAIIKNYNEILAVSHVEKDVWLLGVRGETLMVDLSKELLIRTFSYHNAWSLCRVNNDEWLACSLARDTVVLMNIRSGKTELVNSWRTQRGEKITGYGSEIAKINDEEYAMGSRYHGLYILNIRKKTAVQYINDPDDPSSVASNFIRRVMVTSTGVLAVHGNGVSYSSLDPPAMASVLSFSDRRGKKYKDVVNCFYQDARGQMWIGTNGYLIKWNRGNAISTFYPYYDKGTGPFMTRTLRAVIPDRKNRLWIGAFGSGLGRMLPDGRIEKTVFSAKLQNEKLSNEFHRITADKNGNFLIATGAQFYMLNPLTGSVQTFATHPTLKQIVNGYTTHFFADRSDNWWFAQSRGLSYYDRQKDRLYTILPPGSQKDNNIFAVEQDSGGMIYACGYYGVYIIDPQTRQIKKTINKYSGLESSYVVGLLKDLEGNIWIIGNRGLACYAPQTRALTVFDEKDGLIQSNHRVSAYYLTPDGEMFIGTQTGFNHFYPSALKRKAYVPKVYITGLQAGNQKRSTLSNSGPLVFNHQENNLVFHYLTVDYRNGNAIRYRYRLKGFDTAYIDAFKERQARYTNLPPGSYHFLAEASVNGTHWFAAAKPVYFSITPAFWTTWQFRLLALCLALCIIFALYKWRIAQIKKESRLRRDFEIRLNELEHKALRTQMNPHFIFNSLNTINSFINSNDRLQANQYISKFSRLVRLTLDHSRSKKIFLKDELEVIKIYVALEQLRFDQRFSYTIDVQNVDADTIEIPSMIIQPFVENAILHGLLPSTREGKLKIAIAEMQGMLLVTIEDNGIGRAAAQKNKEQLNFNRKSHGMDITLKRIEAFNSQHQVFKPVQVTDLKDEQGAATGTRVEVLLALSTAF